MSLISLTAADNHTFDSYVSLASDNATAALVILQEIFGVTDQLQGVADYYAELGFTTIVPALFDRQARNTVVPFDQAEKGLALMEKAKFDNTMLDINAAINDARDRAKKVFVMGFCWGGGLAFRCAQQTNIDGAIVFYGTRLGESLDKPLLSPVIGHFGAEDPHTPPDVLQALRARYPEIEMHMYDAGHAFANDAREAYLPRAAELAHGRNDAFIRSLCA